MIFVAVFSILLISVYSLYYLGVDAVVTIANMHGHDDFVMGIALIAFILKIGVKALIQTTPEAVIAVRDAQVEIKKSSNERKIKRIVDELVRQMTTNQLPICCGGAKLRLNYATFETIENVGSHAFTTKSGAKDHRRKFNPVLSRLTGTGSCPNCSTSHPVALNYFIDESGSPKLHQS